MKITAYLLIITLILPSCSFYKSESKHSAQNEAAISRGLSSVSINDRELEEFSFIDPAKRVVLKVEDLSQFIGFSIPKNDKLISLEALVKSLHERDHLIREMSEFKIQILGSEEQNVLCKKNELKNYLKMIEDKYNRNSCSADNFEIDQRMAENTLCSPIKKWGLLDVLSQKIKKENAKDKGWLIDSDNFYNDYFLPSAEGDKQTRVLRDKALSFYNRTNKILQPLFSAWLQNDNQDEREKIEAEIVANINNYYQSTFHPLRDFLIFRNPYLKTPEKIDEIISSFQLSLSRDFFDNMSKNSFATIKIGENPMQENLMLDFKNEGASKVLIVVDKSKVLDRDIRTILKAPTAKSYVTAMKWNTMNMIINQMINYKVISNQKIKFDVPQSCSNSFNGQFVRRIESELPGSDYRNKLVNAYLANTGLYMTAKSKNENNEEIVELDPSFKSLYLDGMSRDPMNEGVKFNSPFEDLKTARFIKGQSTFKDLSIEEKMEYVQFDDIIHFDQIMETVSPKINYLFKKQLSIKVPIVPNLNRYIEKSVIASRDGDKIFTEIVTPPKKSQDAEGTLVDFPVLQDKKIISIKKDPHQLNFNSFLTKIAQSKKTINWEEFLKPATLERMKKNRVKISYPNMYGSVIWRQWALTSLANFFYVNESLPKSSTLSLYINQACSLSYNNHYMHSDSRKFYLKICQSPNPIKSLSEALSEHRYLTNLNYDQVEKLSLDIKSKSSEGLTINSMLPLRHVDDRVYSEQFYLLKSIWNLLSLSPKMFPVSETDEFSYLSQQMSANNPWASMKISYMVAMEQLNEATRGKSLPGYMDQFVQFWGEKEKLDCTSEQYLKRKERFQAAGKILALDQVFSPNHYKKVLSADEKLAVFKKLNDSNLDSTWSLMTSEVGNKNKVFENLDQILRRPLLNYSDAKAIQGLPLEKTIDKELARLNTRETTLRSAFLYKLYQMRNRPEEQFQTFMKEAVYYNLGELDNPDGSTIKELFLNTELNFKALLYEDTLIKGARNAHEKLYKKLDRLCSLSVNQDEELKEIFASTSKAQTDLNKLMGFDLTPDVVTDKTGSMTDHEWENMKLGLFWGMGSAIMPFIGSAMCASVGAIPCLPIGLLSLGGTVTSASIFTYLTIDDFDYKNKMDIKKQSVMEMENANYAEFESHKQYDYGWGAIIFNTASMLPIIPMTLKSLNLSQKMILESYQAYRASKSSSFKASMTNKLQLENLKTAMHVLRMRDESSKIVENRRLFTEHVQALKTSMQSGEISKAHFRYLVSKAYMKYLNPSFVAKGKVLHAFKDPHRLPNVKETNNLLIDSISTYFKGDYFRFKNYIRQFREQAEYSKRRLSEINAEEVADKKLAKLAHKAKKGLYNFRQEHLAELHDEIVTLEKKYANYPETEAGMRKFLEDHIEESSRIFSETSMRKRSIPYMFTFQGSPRIPYITDFGGRQIPILGFFSEDHMIKRMFQARQALVQHALNVEAFAKWGVKSSERSIDLYDQFQHFERSVIEASTRLKDKPAEQVAFLKSYFDFMNEVTEVIYKKNAFKPQYLLRFKDKEEFKRVMFMAYTNEEKALAKALWETADHEILKLESTQKMATQVAKELAGQYKTENEFESLLQAWKIIYLTKNPQMVDL